MTTHNIQNRQTSVTRTEIEPRNPSKREAAHPRVRQLSHWDRRGN